ncbi:MAG: hypothetical protein IV100_33400 [Myxococcales bacterium]|nr:hypothetical protein [Myxococcales bacterium]
MNLTPTGTTLALTSAITVYALIAFRQWRSRILALVTLLPLAAVAGTLVWTGRRDREEATDVDSKATFFGDGQHVAGQSHATGAGPVGAAPVVGGAHGAEPAASGAALADTVIARVANVTGVTVLGAAERYTTATLWNRIDGGAELYTKNGLVRAAMVTAVSQEVPAAGAPTEFEVQVFEMTDDGRAEGLWSKVERDPSSPALEAGRRAVTWRGGGEVLVGAVYARVVVSSAEPSAADAALAQAILVALGRPTGAAPPSPAVASPEALPDVSPAAAKPAAANPVPDAASSSASPVLPAEATGQLVDFGAPAHFELVFGPVRVVLTVEGVTVATFPSTSHAAAFLQATRPESATRVGPVGWSFSRESARSPVVAGLAEKSALLAAGDNAEALLGAERARLGEGALPALRAFASDAEVELRVGEWGGRAALGLVAVQRLPDGAELVVAVPRKLDAAWSALGAGLTEVSSGDGTLAGLDPFQGPLLAHRLAKMILIVAGRSDLALAKETLDAAAGRANATAP